MNKRHLLLAIVTVSLLAIVFFSIGDRNAAISLSPGEVVAQVAETADGGFSDSNEASDDSLANKGESWPDEEPVTGSKEAPDVEVVQAPAEETGVEADRQKQAQESEKAKPADPKLEKESIIAEDNKNKAQKDKYLTDPVPEGKPQPVEWQDVTINKDKELTCTLSVTCKTILDNLHRLNPDKLELVPEDGVIFPAQQVTFYEGESVFDVLLREMQKHKIHMEFVRTPVYNSHYIEGINNLYEFDCGELSGWMYKVNDWFPNYGASRYMLKDGDVVEWIYTCDLGRDIGGYHAVTGGEQ